MTEYPIKVEFKNPATGELKKYKVRQCGAHEDDSLVLQMAGPDGKTNENAVWISRIARDYEGLTEDQVRKLGRWETESLVYFWKKYNEMDIGIFLEEQKKGAELPKQDTSSTTS